MSQMREHERRSRGTPEARVREALQEWCSADYQRAAVAGLAADVIERCHARNPDGWNAAYVANSRFDAHRPHRQQRRLTIGMGLGYVLVVHSAKQVFLAAPPEAVDPEAHRLAESFEGVEGTIVSWSDDLTPSAEAAEAQGRHRFVEVPIKTLDELLEKGLTALVDPAVAWRTPGGRSPRWKEHCAAVVRVLGEHAGRELPQPAYEAEAAATLR